MDIEAIFEYGYENAEMYILIGILILSVVWCFVNFKYLHMNNIIKKTKLEVDKCTADINKLKGDIDDITEAINNIDGKIVKIESIIKAETQLKR